MPLHPQRVVFDTTVLLQACVTALPGHTAATRWVDAARGGRVRASVAEHSLVEFYARLTTLPVRPRVSPEDAVALLDEVVLPAVEVLDHSAGDTVAMIRSLPDRELLGATVFDAKILSVAEADGIGAVVTSNTRHYLRAADGTGVRVIDPADVPPDTAAETEDETNDD